MASISIDTFWLFRSKTWKLPPLKQCLPMEFFQIILSGVFKYFVFYRGFPPGANVSGRLVDHSKSFKSQFCSKHFRNCLTNATKINAITLNTFKVSDFSINSFSGNNSMVWSCVFMSTCCKLVVCIIKRKSRTSILS